ncbi:hypothetical protein B0H14DRAFT_2389367, partial [Mycena olivaceomarginata]
GAGSFSTTHLTAARVDLGIKDSIKSSSETRFYTCHIEAKAIKGCMPGIRQCVEQKLINKKLLPYISDTQEHYTFMSKLSAFIHLTTAPANAILALEGQYINCADVFFAWVCMAWSFERLFATSTFLLEYRAPVLKLFNARFDQMMSESSYNIFMFAYFLHPSE